MPVELVNPLLLAMLVVHGCCENRFGQFADAEPQDRWIGNAKFGPKIGEEFRVLDGRLPGLNCGFLYLRHGQHNKQS